MLARTTSLDPDQVRLAEKAAEQKWGPNWRSKRLDHYFGPVAEAEPVLSLNRRTYLIQVAPQMEGRVAETLVDAGFTVFLPREPKSVRVGHIKRRTIMRPMLPGYLFPIFDEHRDYWQVITRPDKDGKNGIEGVLKLFVWGDRPVPIPVDQVQRIQNAEIEKSMGKRRKMRAVPLEIASVVQIIEHRAFGGWIGTVIEISAEKWEADVELDIFGRKVPVTVSVDCLKVID